MRYILSLSFMLICSTFDCLSQVESTTMRLPDRSPSQCCIPTVIQSTGNFDKDVMLGYAQGSLDITDPEIDGLAVSPNPTKGHLSVSVPADYIGLEILIVDMTGRFVGNPIPIVGTTESFIIEGESGMYLLMIKTQERVITERIQLNTY